MHRRAGIFGVTEESLRLVQRLNESSGVEIVRLWDAEPAAALALATAIDPDLAEHVAPLLTNDLTAFGSTAMDVLVASHGEASARELLPNIASQGLQLLTPLTARLLWDAGSNEPSSRVDLLEALNEIIESVDLTVDSDEIFARMMEVAVAATHADGGSLMLLDPETRHLRIRVAIGVEPELWPKIRVRLGEGIAGRVAENGRPLLLRGKADQDEFKIVRERFDVESALSVPLVHEGRVLGVLNIHHSTRTDAFGDDTLRYLDQLAQLDAKLIARSQAHESLRNQAARYQAIREVQGILASHDHLTERLRGLCEFVASRLGGGIATVYLYDGEEQELRLAATSLHGGGFGGEYRIEPGEGIDGRAAASRRPCFLPDERGKLAYAALPLLAGQRLIGVLTVQAGPNPPSGRATEETLLEIAAAAAEGIAHVDREARMAARATRINAINETGIRMLSATETSEVTRLATSSACMILEADHAVLRLQDEDTLRYVIRSYYGSADGRLQERLFRLDKRVSVEVIKRRTPLMVRELAGEERWKEYTPGFRSVIAAPLKHAGRVIGTLSLYDKVAAGQFYTGHFNDDDLQVFTNLISYVERALDNALLHGRVRQHRNFDDETGLPNLNYLNARLHEEIARAQPRQGTMALVVCRIENLDAIKTSSHPATAHQVIMRTAEALRAHIRDFDVLGRTGDAEFQVLMPDPGPSAGDRVVALARAVADAVSKEESLNDPVRVALAFGHGHYPNDGTDRESLTARAKQPRIRMF